MKIKKKPVKICQKCAVEYIFLTVSMLVIAAVHPSLLALAVVALAVGALDDAGGAASRLVAVTVAGGDLGNWKI